VFVDSTFCISKLNGSRHFLFGDNSGAMLAISVPVPQLDSPERGKRLPRLQELRPRLFLKCSNP